MATSSGIAGRNGLLRGFAALVVLAGFSSTVPAAPRPERVDLGVDRAVAGDEALRVVGDRMPAVAALNRMSSAKLTRILRDDLSAHLDRGGRLFYVEEPAPDDAAAAEAPAVAEAPPYSLDQTFTLHSRPGASRVIYLDFDGYVASGTAWSTSTLNEPAYDTDGNPGSFSDAELEDIQHVWQRVSEDYAPFDVDITTQEPATASLARNGDADGAFGTRAVITAFDSSLCKSCGGVAYVGVFDDSYDWSRYQPAWIFYDKLHSEKNVAEAVSHEVGHNLGLNHDAIPGSGYYGGHGDGATGWAPIMGVGYYKPVSQWSKGEYPNATNQEDDLSIIPSHGALLRADDYGDTRQAAATLASTPNGATRTIDQAGVISTRADVDVFSFDAAAGALHVVAGTDAIAYAAGGGGNLDVQATLYDASGNVLVTANDPAGLSATIDTTLPSSGTYYLAIDGVGDSDPAPGYSDYASLGQYRITGSYGSPPAALPKVSLELETASYPESAGIVTVAVNLTAPSAKVITVPLVFSGTATIGGVDYSMPKGKTITIPAGHTAGTVTLNIVKDTMDEPDETIVISLGTPANADKGAVPVETITIVDDDAAPTVSFSKSAATFIEGGSGFVDLKLSAKSAKEVKVTLLTSGTATRGVDYKGAINTATIPKGTLSVRITLTSIQDAVKEGDETVATTIDSAVNASVGATKVFTATIQDND